MPASLLRTLLVLALALPAAGCGLVPGLGGSDDELVAEGVHVVFLTRADCPYFVAQTRGGGFAILAADGAYAARRGDLLVGDLREGPLELRTVPFPEEDLSEPVGFEVASVALPFAEAQARWRRYCPADG